MAAVLPLLEHAFGPLGGRPHWGKLHSLGADDAIDFTAEDYVEAVGRLKGTALHEISCCGRRMSDRYAYWLSNRGVSTDAGGRRRF